MSLKQGTRFGISRTERLKDRRRINKLFSTGPRFKCRNFVIIYLPAQETKTGFVASKQIGGAVKRNRARRILREAYRMHKEIFRGLEVIFYAQGRLDLDDVVVDFKSFPRRK